MFNKNTYRIILFLSLITINSIGQEGYYYSNQLKIELPSSLTPMRDADKNNTFSRGNKPDYAYKSSDSKAFLSMRKTDYETYNEDMPNVKDFFTEQFIKQFSAISWLSKRVLKTKHGYYFIELEFLTNKVNGMYNLFYLLTIDDRLVMINFSCPTSVMSNWQDVGKNIMQSIVIYKK